MPPLSLLSYWERNPLCSKDDKLISKKIVN